MEGDKKAILQSTVQSWHRYTHDVLVVRAHEDALKDQESRFNAFMDEKHIELEQSVEAARRELAKNTAEMMVKKWLMGETKGLLTSVLNDWRRYTKKVADQARQHEAAKGAVTRWLLGDAKANKMLAMTHWKMYHELMMHHKAAEAAQAARDAAHQQLMADVES